MQSPCDQLGSGRRETKTHAGRVGRAFDIAAAYLVMADYRKRYTDTLAGTIAGIEKTRMPELFGEALLSRAYTEMAKGTYGGLLGLSDATRHRMERTPVDARSLNLVTAAAEAELELHPTKSPLTVLVALAQRFANRATSVATSIAGNPWVKLIGVCWVLVSIIVAVVGVLTN